jgi:hypothetical protein
VSAKSIKKMDREPRNMLEKHACKLNYAWYVDMLRELEEDVVSRITTSLFNPNGIDGDERTCIVEHLTGSGLTEAHANEIVDACLDDTRRANSSCWSQIQSPAPKSPPASPNAARKNSGNVVVEPPTNASDDAKDVIRTTGRIYDPKFLEIIDPLYDLHMGAENMGPILYALTRFVKPNRVLEVGAGYTSIFLLQALQDNADELQMYRDLRTSGRAKCGDVPWSVDGYDGFDAYDGQLHIMDNMAHHATTAHLVQDIAAKLGNSERLHVHVADAFNFDLASTLAVPKKFDLLWIDLGAANRIAGFFDAWWSRVNENGGMVLVHSTLTNELSRSWLQSMRELARDREQQQNRGYGCFTEISFLEPMKMFQNSFTVFQRRGLAYDEEYQEPVLTKYP